MAHELGTPLPGAPPLYHELDEEVEEIDDPVIPRNSSRIHPWCSVVGCTERPLRQYMVASSKKIMFMCKTHFSTVSSQTRDGWKQYRGSRTFLENKVVPACRPGQNRGNGASSSDVDPGYTNHPDDERVTTRGQTKNAMWPGKVYNVLYQVWNAHAEQKKIDTGDSYLSSCHRADLVPEAARVLREQGHVEMANILDNTTEGARKVIHSRVLAKYLKHRETFTTKLQNMGLDRQEVAEWDAALSAAQHHAELMPAKDRDAQQHQASVPHPQDDELLAEGAAGEVGVDAIVAEDEPGRALFNGTMMPPRKKSGRKGKGKPLMTPEAKRSRALNAMVLAAERSNALQKGAAEAGAEHLRRLELADAERLGMEKEEHALRMAIGKSALSLLNKMVVEAPLQLEPPNGPGPVG